MTELDEALTGLKAHEGVEHVLLLGHDGLLIRHLGGAREVDPETLTAMVPGVVSACASLARAADGGGFATAVLEYERGVTIVAALSGELLLAVLLRPQVGFAPLLRQLRQQRSRLADLL